MVDDKARPEQTDEQLQARFDDLVASYAENGSLPDKMAGGPGFGGDFGGEGMRGGHGGGRGGPQGAVPRGE